MPKTYEELKKLNNSKKNNIYNYLISLSEEDLEKILNQKDFFNSQEELIRLMKLMRSNQRVLTKLITILENKIYQDIETSDITNLTFLEKIIKTIRELQENKIKLEINKIMAIIKKYIDIYLPETIPQQNPDNISKNDEQISETIRIIFDSEDILDPEILKETIKYLIEKDKSYIIEYFIIKSISEIKQKEYTDEEKTMNYNKSKRFLYLLFMYNEILSTINKEKGNIEPIDIPSYILKEADYPEQFIINLQHIINLSEPILSIKILQNRTLIQYLNPNSIIAFFQNKSNNNFESFKSIIFDDDININLVNLLNSDDLLKIFPFNDFINTNSETIELLIDFLKRYFTYEKAIFFVSLLELDEKTKKHIIQKLYQKNNIDSISSAKEEIISYAINNILNLTSPVPEYFQKILPELFAIDFNDEVYKKIKQIYLSMKDNEYIKVFLMHYFRHKLKIHNIKDLYLYFTPPIAYKFATQIDGSIIFTMEENKQNQERDNIEYIITMDHELEHRYQKDKKHKISIDSLMLVLSAELSSTDEDYQKNYQNLYREIDARTHSIVAAYRFIDSNDKDLAKTFIKDNLHYSGDISDFLSDRTKAKTPEYFCDLLTTFFKEIESEEIIEIRNEYKVVELITDKNGRPYTPEEIEKFIEEIKASDLKYSAEEKSRYTFLVRYLHLLKEGIEKGLLDIYDEHSQSHGSR